MNRNREGEGMEQKKEKGNFMEKLATVIVDKRNVDNFLGKNNKMQNLKKNEKVLD